VRSHQSRAEGRDHLSHPTGHGSFDDLSNLNDSMILMKEYFGTGCKRTGEHIMGLKLDK